MGNRVQSGRSVGNALGQAATKLRQQQDQCLSSLRKLDESIGDLVQRRGETLVELARHYLPDVSRESVLKSFRDIRDELLDVLARKQRRERLLRAQIQQNEADTIRDQADLEQVTEQLNEKVAERERLEEVVADRLATHEEFQQLSQKALVAEQELDRNEVRVAESKQEAAEKLPSYQKNRLFRYLHERGYGTAEYKKRGFVKRLDDWVAKLIDFARARRSYDFLRVTPELMAAEVVRRREHFNLLMEQVEAIEDAFADEVGLTEVMRQGQTLGSRRDDLVAAIADLQVQFADQHRELLVLEGTQNEFYEQGVDQMKSFLSEMEQSRLEHQSRSTPERQDDELVGEIGWISQQLVNAQDESGALAKEQRSWDERALGLQDVRQRFRKSEYDSRRSLFSDAFDVERHVADYLRGELGREQLWSAIRQYQQFAPSWHEQRGWSGDDSWDTGDLSSVLGRVLVEVAGEALRHAAYRGMQRRGPIRYRRRLQTGLPPFRNRGFTKGRGF